jgi:lipoprotein-anchoring transpeptidase ErfK/SrfK
MNRPLHTLLSGLALAGSAFFTSCVTTQPSVGGMGTQYLGSGLPSGTTENALLPDNISFWDGSAGSGPARVVVRIGEQVAEFYKGDTLVGKARVSTGVSGRETPTGKFSVLEKDRNHRSSRYGDFVNADGSFAQRDVDVKLNKAPAGSHFEGSKMTNFMRVTYEGVGMHAGFLPGYAASHGCIRMPDAMSATFYDNVQVGTPVTITY